jgi:hypothetical protein
MREFKFRVWDLEKKFYLNQDDEFHFYEPDRGWQCPIPLCECLRDKKRYVVQQYTGLTDINNNPIYQGDIVKYIPSDFASGGNTRVGAVIFCNYFNGWAVKDATNYSVYNLNVPFMGLNRIEVIGNIFENPELLK